MCFCFLDPKDVSVLHFQSLAGVLETGPHAAHPVGTEGLGCGGFAVSLWMEEMFSPPCVSTYQNPSPPPFPATDKTVLPGTLTCRQQDITYF